MRISIKIFSYFFDENLIALYVFNVVFSLQIKTKLKLYVILLNFSYVWHFMMEDVRLSSIAWLRTQEDSWTFFEIRILISKTTGL